jgi:hypothetical protein
MTATELAALLRDAARFVMRHPKFGHCRDPLDWGVGVRLRERLLKAAEALDPADGKDDS